MMPRYALISALLFLAVAIIAGVFGFASLSEAATRIAHLLVAAFLVLYVAVFFFGKSE